jgi:hypothetical protein
VSLFASVLVAATLGAPPTYTVAVTRRVGMDAQAAMNLAELFAQALDKTKGKPLGTLLSPRAFVATLTSKGMSDPESCAGAADCAVVIARGGGVDRLIAVQIAKVGGDALFDVTALEARDGTKLANISESVPIRKPARALDRLAASLAPKIPPFHEIAPPPPPEPLPPPPPPPEPVTVTAATPVASGTSTTEVEAKTPPARYVAYGVGALAVVAAGVGVVAGASALSQANTAAGNQTSPNYAANREQALGTARVADFAYGGAAVFAAGAVILWILTRRSSSPADASAPGPAAAIHW